MKVQEIGTRGLLFTFDDPYKTNLYAMNGEKFLFICDTFLGPDSMNEVIVELKKKGFFPKPVIVFNSHHDYDHGNLRTQNCGYCGYQCQRCRSSPKPVVDQGKRIPGKNQKVHSITTTIMSNNG